MIPVNRKGNKDISSYTNRLVPAIELAIASDIEIDRAKRRGR